MDYKSPYTDPQLLEARGYKKWYLDLEGTIQNLNNPMITDSISIKDSPNPKRALFTTIHFVIPGKTPEDKINYIYNLHNNLKAIYCKSHYDYYFVPVEE